MNRNVVKDSKRKIIARKRLKWKFFSIISDLFFVNLGFIVSFLIRFQGHLPPFNFEAYTSLALYLSLVFLLTYYVHDLYELERQHDLTDTLVRLFQANFLAIVIVAALSFVIRVFSFPRSVFLISYFVISILVAGWRYLVIRLFPVELPEQFIAVVGDGTITKRLVNEIRKRREYGLRFSGLITTSEKKAGITETLGTIDNFHEIIEKEEIDRVIITSPTRHRSLVETLLREEKPYLRVQIVPEIYEIFLGKVAIDTLADIPLIDITYEPETAWAKFGKRIFDIVASTSLLVVLSPLLLLITILVKLTSEGPAFYLQKRCGLNGKVFTCYKFRTMVKDAEKMTGPIYADEKDERITHFGRFLRKYRLDELSQLVNILKGDMSFVGPRPERPEFVEEYIEKIPGYIERLKVKPGATGLAQIYGYYETSPETKLKYDLIYIHNISFFLDMLILLKTVSVVLTGKGAR